MRKKLMAALLGFLMLSNIISTIPVTAEDASNPKRKLTMEEAITYANKEIKELYGATPYYETTNQIFINGAYQTMELSREVWDKHDVLAYGGPGVVPVKDQDTDPAKKPEDKGYYRFLGYTKNGNLIPDPDYKADHASTSLINNYEWIKKPWEPESGLGQTKEPWDGDTSTLPYIKYGLQENYKTRPTLYDNDRKPRNTVGAEDWHTIVKILQPRTNYTPGVGRMWHRWDSDGDGVKENWYIHFSIPVELPKATDIEVVSITNQSPTPVGTNQTARVVIRNNSSKVKTFEAQYYAASKHIKTVTHTLAAGASLNTSFSWTSPDKAQSVVLKALTVPILDETKLDNNEKTFTVEVEALKPPTKKGCADQNSISNSWDELYQWQVRHDDTIEVTDPETGETTSEPYTWWEHKSEIVGYRETLSATLTINTKQGLPTDPKRPKESDRESRGSWEIIPYANKKGLNPNEVTRAGYGFEVKLKTTYSNDWESKVPEGASPHGGKFLGPTEVTVEFYNTKGKFVEEVKLVPTQGKAGDRNITWELPQEKYTFQSGKVIYERKHYVDITVPDGKYLAKVTISGVGKTDLCLTRQKNITIYGDMYDDSYTMISR